jgi:hypothetical protein
MVLECLVSLLLCMLCLLCVLLLLQEVLPGEPCRRQRRCVLLLHRCLACDACYVVLLLLLVLVVVPPAAAVVRTVCF